MPDPSKLLPQAKVRLIGRKFGTLNAPGESPADCDVANIQAFTYDGKLVQMRAPTLFLVPTNSGTPLTSTVSLSGIGLVCLDPSVQFADDLFCWVYDRNDDIARLDSSSGTVQRMVIDLESGGSQSRRFDAVGQESSWMARLGLDH